MWLCLSALVSLDLDDSQVVRRITERGYRNMAGSKNPEASVTGALSRDVLFTRLGPATYALAVRTCLGRLPGKQQLMHLRQGLVVKHVRLRTAIVVPQAGLHTWGKRDIRRQFRAVSRKAG